MRTVFALVALVGLMFVPAAASAQQVLINGFGQAVAVAPIPGSLFFVQSGGFGGCGFRSNVVVQNRFGTNVIVQQRSFRPRVNVQINGFRSNGFSPRTVVRTGGLRGFVFGNTVRSF